MLFPLPGRSSNPAECSFQQGISSSSSSSIKLCESRVYVNAGPLLTTASGKASAILKGGVVKCFGSPVEQKISKINAVIYNTCMPSTNFYSSLELSTCRRFAFFSLGYLTVLFLPFTAPGASWSLKALSHACSQGAMPKASAAESPPAGLSAQLHGAFLLTRLSAVASAFLPSSRLYCHCSCK